LKNTCLLIERLKYTSSFWIQS